MYLSKDLIRLPVYDGSGEILGSVDGIGINFDSGDAYLIVEGEALKKIRGRLHEPIPFTEVYEIKNQKIHLKPALRELEEIITHIPQESVLINTQIKNLVGFNVCDREEKIIGKIIGGAIERNQGKQFLLVAGKKIKKIRGRDYEMIPAHEVEFVDHEVHLGKPFRAIKEFILHEHIHGLDKV